MARSLVILFLGAVAMVWGGLMQMDPARAGPQLDNDTPCAGLSLTRGLKYGDNDQNLIDVASKAERGSTPRPVLLFVAGEHFTGDDAQTDWTLRMKAMCLAADNGMVGVTMSYRRAPEYSWPAGAKDVAAATSWIRQNIDLFGGDPKEIIAIGYFAGASHLAAFLAHREFQETETGIAGAILVSGTYSIGANASDGERAYFGSDASKYGERSAFPGILKYEAPIVLAWSAADPPRVVEQAKTLKERLCKAGLCPRVAEVPERDAPASVFDLNGAQNALAERAQQLIMQVEARGMP